MRKPMRKIYEVPLSIRVSKNKVFRFNLNAYRNAHHMVLSKAKRLFTESMTEQRKRFKFKPPVRVFYRINSTNRFNHGDWDLMNVGSVVDKFFIDYLVKTEQLPNDTRKEIPVVVFEYDGKVNPGTAEVVIEEIS